jgi:N6-adenosine-specific RNA methylase IME4
MDLPNKKYQIIYADPPWEYRDTALYKNYRPHGFGAEHHYKTMSINEICNLDINSIADKNSVLFLWITVPLLPEGLKVLIAWGYQYKTSLFWRKIMSLGCGHWFRGQVEVLLMGIKGNIKAFHLQKCNFVESRVKKHSQKPDEFYRLIEMTKLNPKIELFARHRREGWDVWGLEAPTETQMLLKKTG